MTNLDQFESAFRSASRTVFEFERRSFNRVALLTDLDGEAAQPVHESMRAFLAAALPDADFEEILGPEYGSVQELLTRLGADSDREQFDLVCTYRNLERVAWPASLGTYVDVLTQATSTPTLLMPRPGELPSPAEIGSPETVMVMTDHLQGNHALVSAGASIIAKGGTLLLSHIEDELAFERLMVAISKIPDIDTDTARQTIRHQLLKDPHDFVTSCRDVLADELPGIAIEELVVMGHHLAAYRQLIGDHAVDLLVMNTKDDDQMAMHGMAYPLAVELRAIPMLLL